VSVALQITFDGNMTRYWQVNIPIRGHHKLQILYFLRNGLDFQIVSPGNTLQFLFHIPQIYFEMGSMLTSPTSSVGRVLTKMECRSKTYFQSHRDVLHAISTDDVAM
jgi:hypothetical protein